MAVYCQRDIVSELARNDLISSERRFWVRSSWSDTSIACTNRMLWRQSNVWCSLLNRMIKSTLNAVDSGVLCFQFNAVYESCNDNTERDLIGGAMCIDISYVWQRMSVSFWEQCLYLQRQSVDTSFSTPSDTDEDFEMDSADEIVWKIVSSDDEGESIETRRFWMIWSFDSAPLTLKYKTQ